ncbi:ABC transporter substrate-binding protein [Vibrio ziniensis]|uniref:Carbohydrate ABC transporter substrate-binding protein n=1 Tax=Vibrio ziniensis TaxID=2711221 RepID=A0A6G7CQD2_9VIBR|nr:ABC transporter substrate-binding protein [Vibrio ziniensis]QIH44289.1 carbohydrate ABC transporter substrate-binding protein [Vibrio ziniensis]
MKTKLVTTVTSLTLAIISASAFAEIELRMSWWGGNERHQATNAAIERFEAAHPDIKVKAEYTGWDGALTRLTTQIAGNTEPDVMQTNLNWMPIFSKDGNGFYDLKKVKPEIALENFAPAALNTVTFGDKLNGIPVSMTSRVFFYNHDTWTKAGVAYPNNWDELMAAGKAFQSKLGDKYFPIVLEAHDVFAMNRSYMIQTMNKDILSTDGKINFTPEEMTSFFKLYVQQVNNHVFPSTKEFASYGKANLYEMRPWLSGEFGGVYMWDSAITKYTDNLTLDLAPYPMAKGAKDAGLLSRPSMMFSVGRNSKHPAEAAKLINFLLNDTDGIKALGLTRGIPLSSSGMKVLKSEGTLDESNLAFAGYQQALSLPQIIASTPYTDNAQLIDIFSEELQAIDYGESTPEKAAKSFISKANRMLARLTR